MDESVNDRMARVAGLEKDTPRAMRPSGASCDLQDELSGPLGGAKVAAKEAAIDIQDADQRDVGKMVPFSEHLGANENICLAVMHRFEIGFELALPAGGVAVNSNKPMGRKKPG